jgi:hypothetical protein
MTALPCDELGRVTRAYVSGYQRARVHDSRLVRGESRCLVANFNGSIGKDRTIASVTWRTNQYQSIYMANARIPQGAREAAVDITAQTGSRAWVKCEATMDNGEVYTQLFAIEILGNPWFAGEATPSIGPSALTAEA